MIIKTVEIEKFRAFQNVSFALGRCLTAIAGRNATQKTTLLGLIGQPFTISSGHIMYGCKTIDGYNFKSQFKEKFKLSATHDAVGEHKWKLNLHNGIYQKSYYKVESIARKQAGRVLTLRFWNAESRERGAGYIQLPVYFLSLSRLFPIGESGKTKTVNFNLTSDELNYCIKNYREILSIHHIGNNASIGIEKGTSLKTFSGISDDTHDIFTNSAGESNITRIILAILSFKRLKDTYNDNYKGGILLIDELDATLYGFSQTKLIDYLLESSKNYRIQIIFTTHSPIILKHMNKYQRKEQHDKKTSLPHFAYDTSIVYLEPHYDQSGVRTIKPKNLLTNSDVTQALNDINLNIFPHKNKLNVYCEDKRATNFLKYVLSSNLHINLNSYMSFIDVNLGWTNYVQLARKEIPEFTKNLIILDGDVPQKEEFKNVKDFVNSCNNFLFLPILIEKDIFTMLKDHAYYSEFQSNFSNTPEFSYDICFNNWPLEEDSYTTKDYKSWYNKTLDVIRDETILFNFWCSKNTETIKKFIENFINKFNTLAEENDIDELNIT